jgi:hypothetical protein
MQDSAYVDSVSGIAGIDRHGSNFTASILNVAYGFEVPSANDPYILNAEEVVGAVGLVAIPGSFLVDTFPLRE